MCDGEPLVSVYRFLFSKLIAVKSEPRLPISLLIFPEMNSHFYLWTIANSLLGGQEDEHTFPSISTRSLMTLRPRSLAAAVEFELEIGVRHTIINPMVIFSLFIEISRQTDIYSDLSLYLMEILLVISHHLKHFSYPSTQGTVSLYKSAFFLYDNIEEWFFLSLITQKASCTPNSGYFSRLLNLWITGNSWKHYQIQFTLLNWSKNKTGDFISKAARE